MLTLVTIIALMLSGLSWAVFALVIGFNGWLLRKELDRLGDQADRANPKSSGEDEGPKFAARAVSGIELMGALRNAGAAPIAAILCAICLLGAGAAALADRLCTLSGHRSTSAMTAPTAEPPCPKSNAG